MSQYRVSSGTVAMAKLSLSGTSATAIVDGNKGALNVLEVWVTNKSGASATIVVDVYDGTTAWEFETGETLADDAMAKLNNDAPIPLTTGESLRITGASGVQVMVVYERPTYNANPA